MELVNSAKSTSDQGSTLAQQARQLHNNQSSIEELFNLASKDLFGAGPYNNISVGDAPEPNLSDQLTLLIKRQGEFILNLTALVAGIREDDK